MTNPFRDQEKFMRACDQTVDSFNQEQFKLYLELMKEEWKELQVAIDNNEIHFYKNWLPPMFNKPSIERSLEITLTAEVDSTEVPYVPQRD